MPSGQQEINQILQSTNLYRDTLELALYLSNKIRGRTQRWSRTGEKLYDLCMEMKSEREMFFDTICEKLNLNSDNINESSIAVMTEVFVDGCNFGRLVALFTFCLTICEFCLRNGLENEIETITKNTALTVCTQKEWFESQGAWDGFLKHFTSPEEKIWKGFVITTVGLGAMASLLYVNS